MATDVSTTSYLVDKVQVIKTLDSTFSKKFTAITNVTSNADNTWTFTGVPFVNGKGYTVTTPMAKVTKKDVSDFLLAYSATTVNSASIVNVKFSDDDATYLEVITI